MTHTYLLPPMTHTYLLPPLLMILIGPHKSICNISRGREVLAHLFDLNEFLTYFPLAQASRTLPSLYLTVGRPTTRSFETNLFKRETCMT